LRDITERVVIASKGRFDRARSVKQRQPEGLPFESSLSSDEFMAATLDVWEIPAESAKRVRHPAPFPVELPERLIRLHTYADDLVLDPFMGSGSALVAAAKVGRRYIGYDLDPTYVAIARDRVRAITSSRSDGVSASAEDQNVHTRAIGEGKAIQAIAERVLVEARFTITGRNGRVRGLGLAVDFIADDRTGTAWYFDLTGGFTTTKGGLLRTDAVWKSLGRAHVLASHGKTPVVLLTSHLPRPGSDGDMALRAGQTAFFDAIPILADDGPARLAKYAKDGSEPGPVPGFWTEADLADRR
jgi:site-specific DNA-methyltransferase (adenine-specific)